VGEFCLKPYPYTERNIEKKGGGILFLGKGSGRISVNFEIIPYFKYRKELSNNLTHWKISWRSHCLTPKFASSH